MNVKDPLTKDAKDPMVVSASFGQTWCHQTDVEGCSAQLTFADAEGLGQRKKTRRELLLSGMDQAVPWKQLPTPIEPYYPLSGRRGRQPYPLAPLLRIDRLRQWYALSDPSMEEAL